MFSASVVITTKNRREELLKAVESAMAQRGLLEVIVIDDGSLDGTAEAVLEMLKSGNAEKLKPGHPAADSGELMAEGSKLVPSSATGDSLDSRCSTLDSSSPQALDSGLWTLDPQSAAKPQLRLIRHEVSAGYIVRRNEGARVAKGDVIFSLDDDAVFSSPFVVEQTLRDFLHPRIGAVAIPYIEPHKANKEMQRAPTQEDVWITASYVGTAHAVRRDVFLALGGYREHLVHQGEEGDFCLRMLAAEQKEKAESGNAEKLKTDLTTIERQGGREKEQPKVGPKGKGVGTNESNDSDKHGWGTTKDTNLHERRDAGPCLDKPSGAAFSNPSPSELARDSESTSLIRSADGPAGAAEPPRADGEYRMAEKALDSGRVRQWNAEHIPTGSTLDSAPLSAVPGFFVRLGNSDPIIHNESPKRDYSRMDFYGRRNDVLFHWQNTPMPDLLWQLPKTIAGGLLCAYRVKRWRKMLAGIGAGFLAIVGGVKRQPVPRDIGQAFKLLKQRSQIVRF